MTNLLITQDGKKTIHTNSKDFMVVIDNDEYIEMRDPKKLGNCMFRTAERFDYLIRKYGMDNFGLFIMCCIMKKNNEFIQHTAIYNKKQDKIIDCANGKIILLDKEIYLEETFKNTKNHYYQITYLTENNITIKMDNKKIKLNDNNIKKYPKPILEDLIMEVIKEYWVYMKEELKKEE
jgi:hypothetical protein